MAMSTYDENLLSEEQRRRIEAFKAEWERANAAGDRAGMDAAHAAAERVRAQAGYSGAADGGGYVDLGTKRAEDKTYTPTPAPETYTPAQLPSYQAQTEAVDRLYDARREAALAALKSAYDANASTLEAQRAEIPGVYQTQRNAVAAQSELAGHNFNEYAAAAGLGSGSGGQAALARSNQLQGDLSALGQQEAAEQRKLESQIAQLKTQYQNDIASAVAQGEYERAAALLEEYRRAAESAVTTAQAQADENYRGYQSGVANAQFGADENYRAWQSGVSSRESDLQTEYEKWQRQLQMAELQAQYGDLSGLKALGVDTSAYEARQTAQAAQSARAGSSGGGSTGGTGSGGGDSGGWVSDMTRMQAAGVRSGADAYSWALANGYSSTEAKQLQANWEAQNKEPETYTGVFQQMQNNGIKTREEAVMFLMYNQKMSREDAEDFADSYMSTLSSTGNSGQTVPSQNELQTDGNGNLVDPGPTASFRKQFLYEFTQRANSGANLQELYDQLDVAVENGWITAAEAESLRLNAQIVATHFAR